MKPSLEERFWSKVDKNGPIPPHCPELGQCWVWTASKNNKGYGWLHRDGKTSLAHRTSWELNAGWIPKGLLVLHRCDNRTCVRPEHLFLGSHRDNAVDMIAKDRVHRALGELSLTAKLTAVDVSNIRELYAIGGTTYRKLGARFGVSHTQIKCIVKRFNWKHVA